MMRDSGVSSGESHNFLKSHFSILFPSLTRLLKESLVRRSSASTSSERVFQNLSLTSTKLSGPPLTSEKIPEHEIGAKRCQLPGSNE